MKKFALLLSFAFIGIQTFAQEVYQSKAMNVRFFSTTPMEDIEAKTANATSIITTAKNDILFMIQVKSFTFKSSLMQEHFNENYMESDKFPEAKFIGKINESIDWKKDGKASAGVIAQDIEKILPSAVTPEAVIVPPAISIYVPDVSVSEPPLPIVIEP